MKLAEQHKRAVVGLGKSLRWVRMQHAPYACFIAAVDDRVVVWRVFQFRQNPTICAGTEGHGTGEDFADPEEFVDRLGAADVTEIAVGQHEAWETVDALRAQEWFHHKLNGVAVPAINQPVLLPARNVREHTMAAVERQPRHFKLGPRGVPAPA